MGTIKVSVAEDIEERFRENAMEIFGHRKGSLSKAAEQALEIWNQRVGKKDFSEEILEEWDGMLSHLDETSLEAEDSAIQARADNAFD